MLFNEDTCLPASPGTATHKNCHFFYGNAGCSRMPPGIVPIVAMRRGVIAVMLLPLIHMPSVVMVGRAVVNMPFTVNVPVDIPVVIVVHVDGCVVMPVVVIRVIMGRRHAARERQQADKTRQQEEYVFHVDVSPC